MLKVGIFQTPDILYTVYEVTEPGFYRIDFMRDGGMFQTDVSKVAYSLVRRKKTMVIGNSEIYDLWTEIRHKCTELKMDTNTESEWKDGVYKTTVKSVNEKQKCSVMTYMEMNDVVSEEIIYGDYIINMETTDAIYGVKLNPQNMSEYRELMLSSATVATDSAELPYKSLDTLRRTIDIEHIFKEDFVYADTVEIADKRLAEIIDADPEFLGVDTETMGLDVDKYGDDYIVGVILARDEHTSTYFPFRMENDAPNLPLDYLKKLDKVIMKFISRTVLHNIPFDRKAFLKDGFDYVFKWDTLQGSIILNPVIKKGVHELKNLIYELTGKRYLELSDIFINKKDICFQILPKEIARIYACPDSSNVIKLIKHQLKEIPKFQHKLFEVECALTSVIADHEYFGIRVDVAEYEKQYKNCNYVCDLLLNTFRRLTHCDGNINSSKVLSDLMYNRMHCDVLSRTQTGMPSTSGSAIEKLGAKKRDKPGPLVEDIVDLYGKVIIKGKALSEAKYPALLVLSQYRKYIKLNTAFYARFERTMKTGRIFFWVNQNGAATGRQSSPMHQLPVELKRVILSDTDEHDLWGPDYSQVELRMLAYLAGQKDLSELCRDPDNDIHRAISSLILGCEMWEITPEERSRNKRRNFGAVYLISGFGLAVQVHGPGATKEQVKACQKQLDEFFHTFKWIDRYVKNNMILVQERGYMETKWLHRRRLFPEVFDPDLEPRRRSSIIRMGNNVPVQGTAADLLKMALVLMYQYIREKGWYATVASDGYPLVRIMLSIHDEVLISAHKSIPYEEIIRMITLCMELPVEDAPPFFVQPAKLANWADHENDAVPLPIKLRDKLILDYERTGVSQINHDNYEQMIKDFRKEQLRNYMTGLINQYGDDYKIVGEKVRHPSLTHDLLAAYHDAMKEFEGTQAEKVTEATRLYMLEEDNNMPISISNEKKEDNVIVADIQVQYGELEELVSFDKDGNVIYEDTEQEDVSDFWYEDNVDVEEIKKFAENKPMYAWELADTIVFDTGNMYKEQINNVLKYIHSVKEDDGFFKVFIIYNGNLLDTGMRIEHFNSDEANDFMIKEVNKLCIAS